MGTKMATMVSLATLPLEIFSNILEYVDWGDVGRLDTAFLNHDTRKSYLFALQLREVKVERNWFWRKALDRGILRWLISKNIRVISWDSWVNNDAELISISTTWPQLQSLNIKSSPYITYEGIRALANGLHQLQSLDIGDCDNITDEAIRALARRCPQLQSLDISYCYNITDEAIRKLARRCPQLQSLTISLYNSQIHDSYPLILLKRITASSHLYIGDFVNGDQNGEGRMLFPNGDFFAGQFENGMGHGYGILTCRNGEKYDGDWRNGKIHGRGSCCYPNGDVYHGFFVDNERHGPGVFFLVNGDTYLGDWMHDNHVHGLIQYNDGNTEVIKTEI